MANKNSYIVLILLILQTVSGYNASVEPNITTSAGDITDEFYTSLNTDLNSNASLISNWLMLFILLIFILVGIVLVGKLLGWGS